MKSRWLMTLIAAMSLFFVVPKSIAQMSSFYDTYDNLTINDDGNGGVQSVTLTVTLDGATTWYGNPLTYHTGHVYANFAGTSSSNSVGPVFPNHYMNISTTATLPSSASCWSSGCEIFADEATVDCDIAGQFFDAFGSLLGGLVRLNVGVEDIWYDNVAFIDPLQNLCGFEVVAHCTRDDGIYCGDTVPSRTYQCTTNGVTNKSLLQLFGYAELKIGPILIGGCLAPKSVARPSSGDSGTCDAIPPHLLP